MKLIVAILRPEESRPVQAALAHFDLQEVSVSEVRVRAKKNEGYTLIYRSATIQVNEVPGFKLEIAVDDYLVDTVVDAIRAAGVEGGVKTGGIYARPLEELVTAKKCFARLGELPIASEYGHA